MPVTPSADPQRSSLDINIIETWTTINDIITADKYQALWWDKEWDCLGFLLKHTAWALKNFMQALHYIYLTFGQWEVQAALDISNIRLLKFNDSYVPLQTPTSK